MSRLPPGENEDTDEGGETTEACSRCDWELRELRELEAFDEWWWPELDARGR